MPWDARPDRRRRAGFRWEQVEPRVGVLCSGVWSRATPPLRSADGW